MLTLLVLLLTQTAASVCNSFEYANNYYDINGGKLYDIDYYFKDQNVNLTYNLCDRVSTVCETLSGTDNLTVDFHQGRAHLMIGSECVFFTYYPKMSLVDETNSRSGVKLYYSRKEANGTTTTMFIINPCGTTDRSLLVYTQKYTITTAVDGCPKLDLTTLWDFFARNQLAFFITTEVLGMILMVLGVYLYRITLFLLGTLASFFIFTTVESLVIFQPGVPNQLVSSVLTVSIVTSVLVGYMTLYFPKAGLFVMGMWVGFFLSFVLNNVALYHIKSNPPALPLMISMGVLGLGMGVLSLFVKKSFVIFSTSFIGAYTSIRALSWYLGKYPNEFLIAKQFHNANQAGHQQVYWQYYVYVVALVILTSFSVVIQAWIFRKKSKMLGKKADIDQYIGKIEEDLNMERSKFIKLGNLGISKEKKVKPRKIVVQRSEDEEYEEVQRPTSNKKSIASNKSSKKSKYKSYYSEEEPEPSAEQSSEEYSEESPPPAKLKNRKKSSHYEDSIKQKLLVKGKQRR